MTAISALGGVQLAYNLREGKRLASCCAAFALADFAVFSRLEVFPLRYATLLWSKSTVD